MTMRTSLTVLLFAAVTALGTGAAHADWCYDLRTGQNFDCNQPPPEVKQTGRPPVKAEDPLRDRLKRSLDAAPTTMVDRNALAQRTIDASMRADSALVSAARADGPQEKAQAKRTYDTAMNDLRTASKQLMDDTADPAKKAEIAKALQDSEARHASMAADAGIAGPIAPAAPAPQQAAVPQPNVFSVCEAPEKGVTTCYEIGKTGSACRKVFYQGGELTWRDSQMSACPPGDLAQRDAFYAGKPVGGDPVDPPAIDPRSQQLSGTMMGVSAQCQEDIKNYLYGARDSKGSNTAQNTAMKSFVGINQDPQCKAALEKMASTAGVTMPQRRLAYQAHKTWDAAMADKPRTEVLVPTGQEMASGYYSDGSGSGNGWNTGEVIDTGIKILGILAQFMGAAATIVDAYTPAPTYTSQPASRAPSAPSGNGYVYRPQPPQGGGGSCITTSKGRFC